MNNFINSLPRHVTADDVEHKCDSLFGKTSCDSACSECILCMKANMYRGVENAKQVCFKVCDRCNYCKMRNHNFSQTPDPPYWNMHPLTPNPNLQLYEGDVQRPLYIKHGVVPYPPTKNPLFIPPKNANVNIDKCADPKVPMRVDSYRFQRSLTHPHSKFDVSNVCGVNKKREYEEQYNNYIQCKICRDSGKCWSRYQQKCVNCDAGQMSKTCERLYGCKRNANVPNDIVEYVPPKNPLYTDCRLCWKE